MSEERKYHFETLQLHVGQEQADPATDARAVPIYQTTSFVFHNAQHAADRFALKDAGNVYGRLTNPTEDVFSKRIAALEGGVAAVAVASGAAAVTYTLEALVHHGQHIVAATTIYGGTYNLFEHTFPNYGIETTFVDPTKGVEVFEEAIKENTRAVYIESVGNPNANLIDIQAVADIAHKHKIPLVVDSTFATPYQLRPFEYGADIVVHSATKYLCGHNDIIAGVIAIANADSDYGKDLELYIKSEGPNLTPIDSWLLLRSIKTLGIRVERQAQSAMKVAEWLRTQPTVTDVYYVGLPDHPGHALHESQATGFGSMISFKTESPEHAVRVLGRLKLIAFAESLGGVESLLTYPIAQTHAEMPKELLARTGLDDRLLRLSVGIEDAGDLIADLDQALNG